MMFAGMLRYRLSSETYAQLAHYGKSTVRCHTAIPYLIRVSQQTHSFEDHIKSQCIHVS